MHHLGDAAVVSERRQSPRTPCNLGCQIHRGRDRIRARILDVSDGGLCVFSPVELKKGDSLRIDIEIPKHGPSTIEAFVWHVRGVKNSRSRKQNWSAGMVLVKSDDAYAGLLAPAEMNVSIEGDPKEKSGEFRSFRVRVQTKGDRRSRLLTLGAETEGQAKELALSGNLRVFRVRVQVKGEQRSRLLTLGAETEEEARELALMDLDDSWFITEIHSPLAET